MNESRALTVLNLLEKRFDSLYKDQLERAERRRFIEQLDIPEDDRMNAIRELERLETSYIRTRRRKITINDFELLSVIGRGFYGEVRLCRKIETGEIFAIKILKKSEMIDKQQIQHVRVERDVMATVNNPWTVKLCHSFQDEINLYFVMEYLPGGDMMTLLMRRDILQENEAKFYIAELVLAIESIHKLNFFHRDLKPDNLLIDRNGHLKLSDFGLAKEFSDKNKSNGNDLVNSQLLFEQINENTNASYPALARQQARRNIAFTKVGTADYVAPEVLLGTGYGFECDWWGVGVLLYEMLFGYPPFYSGDQLTTCKKIVNWQQSLSFPEEIQISVEAEDLIRRLLCDREYRLGSSSSFYGAQSIKSHPFFRGVDWDNIINQCPPFVPDLFDELDTSNFDNFMDNDDVIDSRRTSSSSSIIPYKQGNDLYFADFGFLRFGFQQQSFRTEDDDEYDLNDDDESDNVSFASESENLSSSVQTRYSFSTDDESHSDTSF
eukprot:c21157_g2_i1.p1 GENE.c21157_g2_i1~~c21157_g2_i1.p1  ORF type:complete len:494 (+),score=203.83 c21157_g2_i1:123-1604(+)